MDRIDWAAEVIREAGEDVQSVLDVGCRDQVLKTRLPSRVDYASLDLEQNEAGTVTYVGDVADVEFDRRFDCVVALDVLEHTDQPQELFDRLLELADHSLVMTLPNCADLKGRMRFLLSGSLGGKYRFGAETVVDRHRWIMRSREIRGFYGDKSSAHGTHLGVTPIWYGGLRPLRWSGLCGYLLRGLGEGLAASALGAVFVKQRQPVVMTPAARTGRAREARVDQRSPAEV